MDLVPAEVIQGKLLMTKEEFDNLMFHFGTSRWGNPFGVGDELDDLLRVGGNIEHAEECET